eukprot:1142656-Pelagomonas_calceolata.AAC.3
MQLAIRLDSACTDMHRYWIDALAWHCWLPPPRARCAYSTQPQCVVTSINTTAQLSQPTCSTLSSQQTLVMTYLRQYGG